MRRGIVLIPGGLMGPHQPLLSYTWLAARDRGAEAYHVEWPDDRPTTVDDSAPWVHDRIATVLDGFAVPRPVLAGKSLGTFAAGLAADRGLPGIWHTPLLTYGVVIDALRRATAPYLLIGGTRDTVWDGDLARELTPHVVEIPDADHGMIVADRPLARSTDALGEIVTAIEAFLDVVWSDV